MAEWKAAAGRIILFSAAPMSPAQLSPLELYRQVWGGEPDNFQRQTNPLLPSYAQGSVGALTVVCVTQPTRIDFNLGPPSPTLEVAQDFPLIEDTAKLHAELERILA